MFYTYIILSIKDQKIYIGSTEDLKRRLKEHNYGKSEYTSRFGQWKLIYYEAHRNKILAQRAEQYYKSSQGRRQLAKKLSLEEFKKWKDGRAV